MKIAVEINGEHFLECPTNVKNIGNPILTLREKLSETEAHDLIKSWFQQGFVDYVAKSDEAPNGAIKVYIPIRRIIEIYILE